MTPAIPIAEALADANLLGAALGDVASWRTVAHGVESGVRGAAHRRGARVAGALLPPVLRFVIPRQRFVHGSHGVKFSLPGVEPKKTSLTPDFERG